MRAASKCRGDNPVHDSCTYSIVEDSQEDNMVYDISQYSMVDESSKYSIVHDIKKTTWWIRANRTIW